MDSGYHVLSERIFGLYAPKPYIVEKEKNYLSWKETQGGNSTIWGNVSGGNEASRRIWKRRDMIIG